MARGSSSEDVGDDDDAHVDAGRSARPHVLDIGDHRARCSSEVDGIQ
jgi:hypothetical protein